MLEVDAKWTKVLFMNCLFNILMSMVASYYLYHLFFQKYFDLTDLKTYPLLDPSLNKGSDVMDAAKIYFS